MTLTELLVTLVLVVMVTAILAAILKEGFQSYDYTVSEADSQLSARVDTDVMVEDIRSSKIAVIEDKRYPLTGESRLELFNGSSESEVSKKIIYYLDQGTVFREVDGTLQQVAFENVSEFNTSVNEENGLVKVTMVVNPETDIYQKKYPKKIVVQARPRVTLQSYSE